MHSVYMGKRVQPRAKPAYRRTFIRQWRDHRDLTLEQLADRVGSTHVSLSRIERGLQPYSQTLLEALAEALQTDVASLLMRDPTDSEALWSIWEQASEGQRQTLVDIAKTLKKSAS